MNEVGNERNWVISTSFIVFQRSLKAPPPQKKKESSLFHYVGHPKSWDGNRFWRCPVGYRSGNRFNTGLLHMYTCLSITLLTHFKINRKHTLFEFPVSIFRTQNPLQMARDPITLNTTAYHYLHASLARVFLFLGLWWIYSLTGWYTSPVQYTLSFISYFS